MKYLVEMLADSAKTMPEYKDFRDLLSRFLEYEISELTDESQRLAVGLPNCYVDFSQEQGMRLICGDIRLSLNDLRRLRLVVTSVNTRIEALEQRLNSLVATIAELEAAIATLTTRLITAEGQITDLTNRIVALETSITTLTNRVVVLETSITTLTNRVVALEGQTTDLINRITTLEQRPSLSAAILEESSATTQQGVMGANNIRTFFPPNGATVFGQNFITNTNSVITLQAGTYLFYGIFPAAGVNVHSARLNNITANSIVVGSDTNSLNDAYFVSIQTLIVESQFRVQHYLDATGGIMITDVTKGALIILKLA